MRQISGRGEETGEENGVRSGGFRRGGE